MGNTNEKSKKFKTKGVHKMNWTCTYYHNDGTTTKFTEATLLQILNVIEIDIKAGTTNAIKITIKQN